LDAGPLLVLENIPDEEKVGCSLVIGSKVKQLWRERKEWMDRGIERSGWIGRERVLEG
jgi:uncharacterized OB-fold protein